MGAYADALRAYKAGDVRRAHDIIERLHASNPADIRVRTLRAMILARAARLDDAEREMLAAIADCPDERAAFGIRHQLALVHLQQRRPDDALSQIDAALATEPANPVLIATRADILDTIGRADEAAALVGGAVRTSPDNLQLATLHARLCARSGRPADGLDPLEPLIANAPNSMETMRALRQLADLYERLGRYNDAFDAYARAGEMSPVRYDPRATASLVDRLIASWTPEAIAAAPRSDQATDAPVFIVGMPRSGTSLTEQILASHPRVAGVGESDALSEAAAQHLGAEGTLWRAEPSPPSMLDAGAINAAAADYASEVLAPHADAARVTDKHPMNFWRLGLVPLLFPNARVIHCVRDPRDTCLSCWAQHFVGDHPWANRLEDLGHFYAQYARLMTHWELVLPAGGVQLTRAVYEDTVSEQERESRRLIEFLGLDWDDACLRFHESGRVVYTHSNEQVRRPIYASSVARWKRFADRLAPLNEALGDPLTPNAPA